MLNISSPTLSIPRSQVGRLQRGAALSQDPLAQGCHADRPWFTSSFHHVGDGGGGFETVNGGSELESDMFPQSIKGSRCTPWFPQPLCSPPVLFSFPPNLRPGAFICSFFLTTLQQFEAREDDPSGRPGPKPKSGPAPKPPKGKCGPSPELEARGDDPYGRPGPKPKPGPAPEPPKGKRGFSTELEAQEDDPYGRPGPKPKPGPAPKPPKGRRDFSTELEAREDDPYGRPGPKPKLGPAPKPPRVNVSPGPLTTTSLPESSTSVT